MRRVAEGKQDGGAPASAHAQTDRRDAQGQTRAAAGAGRDCDKHASRPDGRMNSGLVCSNISCFDTPA